jgi:Kef-type K+ transport system membrane component KefB
LPQAAIARHLLATAIYFAVGLTIVPAAVRCVSRTRFNLLATASPVAYVLAVLFAYCALAAALDVNLVFAAFLAGFALSNERGQFSDAIAAVGKFSFATFIPIYFAVVGYRLDLAHSFSPLMLAAVLLFACVLKLASVGFGAKLAGFGLLDTINLAIATNARGGPGIVLASVAYDARIINATAFTTLVLLAVLTSQAAGAWLEYVLRKDWPLLSGDAVERKRVEVVAREAA